MPICAIAVFAALQQSVQLTSGQTSPASGDTVGYWQQGISYAIVATLDERAQRVRARARLRYVNHSPDTLREMYVHQYLNAFRPASLWSRVDEREGRERFQHLADPDYGYERFTAPVRVDGIATQVDYPAAPDSTVAHFPLPRPLAPGDSVAVDFEWDARPSTVPRRQARRGRQWDLAQWYPKVAVYDRAGWEYNALQPAGELYGEYGTYDVTLLLPQDQVVGATGVPISGDPGWTSALRAGVARTAARAYGSPAPDGAVAEVPPGYKSVRFLARDVHHFAWSASPDYRYEGGIAVRQLPSTHFPTWDTVSIHVLYRAGDDTTWGGLRVVRRTAAALQWLESIYGPYAYPQMTVLHRLDGGGTEFPMMQMNGSPSQGLILHEGGHVFTYGILGNNEWRSGWMDEGLTSFQTEWAQGFLPQERVRANVVDRFQPATGYRAHAIRMAIPRFDATALDQAETDMRGEAQPIGTTAHEFRDFATYNDMIYTRAQVMYTQLRDVLGDSVFVEFLHDYYNRWALKHVDERAMRASAERVSGRDLGWFFDQWVHHTGITNYRLESAKWSRDVNGRWTTVARVGRRGEYRHPIAVGVRTQAGWTIAHASQVDQDREVVTIVTDAEPIEARLDPYHHSWDWDRRDDVARPWWRGAPRRYNFDWPFLAQADRDKFVNLLRPMAWYSRDGGLNVGVQERSNYLGWVDQADIGLVVATRGGLSHPQAWTVLENPVIGSRPRVGWHTSFAWLDDVYRVDLGYRRRPNIRRGALWTDVVLSWAQYGLYSNDDSGDRLLPELWDTVGTVDMAAAFRWQSSTGRSYWFANPSGVAGFTSSSGYMKGELALGRVQALGDKGRFALRAYAGAATDSTPGQRALLLSSQDAITTFMNHWWRPEDAILKQSGVGFLPLGGAALRGYHWAVRAGSPTIGGNVDLARELARSNRSSGALALSIHGFADAAHSVVRTGLPTTTNDVLVDAGIGLSVSGRLYDRPLFIRVDSPFYVSEPALALDQGHAGRDKFAPRWTITFSNLW